MNIGLAIAILFAVLIAGTVALSAGITMLLWNWVIPALGGPKIGFWLAAGVNLLIGWLFSSRTKLE